MVHRCFIVLFIACFTNCYESTKKGSWACSCLIDKVSFILQGWGEEKYKTS